VSTYCKAHVGLQGKQSVTFVAESLMWMISERVGLVGRLLVYGP
jgi:hypothetical protein